MAFLASALIATSLAGAASAAPLCKDLKGLFTPCPQALNKTAQQKLERRIETLPPEPALAAKPTLARTAAPATHQSAKKSRFTQTKLCKDLKGLFTPCPK